MLLLKLWKYNLSWLELVDVSMVLVLLYLFYKRVRGTLGLNIFFGMLLIYAVYRLVLYFKLPILTDILGQFVSAGVIAMLVVFQPEIRKFLLSLGDISISERLRLPFRLGISQRQRTREQETLVTELLTALEHLSQSKTGALIIFFRHFRLEDLTNPGTPIQGIVTAKLLETIFNKNTPLHDGAVIIVNNRIIYAGSVLPVSDSAYLPPRAGLRHRSAVGITEHSDAVAVVVSEETGQISFARNGKIRYALPMAEVRQILFDIVQDRV
jgi:diadenylate cyclase